MASALPTSSLRAGLGLDRLDHYTRDLKTLSMRTILKKLLRSGVKRSEWSGHMWCCGGSGVEDGLITNTRHYSGDALVGLFKHETSIVGVPEGCRHQDQLKAGQ